MPKGQSKMDNPEKLTTQDTLDEDYQIKNTTQYVLDTTIQQTNTNNYCSENQTYDIKLYLTMYLFLLFQDPMEEQAHKEDKAAKDHKVNIDTFTFTRKYIFIYWTADWSFLFYLC